MKKLLLSAMASLLLATATSVQASSKTPGKVIAGWVEKVTLPATGEILKAKLDTGAETSSVHAQNVKIFKRDGKRWVRFDLARETADGGLEFVTLERQRVRRVRIKDHEDRDQDDSRPVVLLKLCFDGRLHDVQFNLADRSRLIYPMLLGRRFMARVAVVDPGATFLTQARCAAEPDQS